MNNRSSNDAQNLNGVKYKLTDEIALSRSTETGTLPNILRIDLMWEWGWWWKWWWRWWWWQIKPEKVFRYQATQGLPDKVGPSPSDRQACHHQFIMVLLWLLIQIVQLCNGGYDNENFRLASLLSKSDKDDNNEKRFLPVQKLSTGRGVHSSPSAKKKTIR